MSAYLLGVRVVGNVAEILHVWCQFQFDPSHKKWNSISLTNQRNMDARLMDVLGGMAGLGQHLCGRSCSCRHEGRR